MGLLLDDWFPGSGTSDEAVGACSGSLTGSCSAAGADGLLSSRIPSSTSMSIRGLKLLATVYYLNFYES